MFKIYRVVANKQGRQSRQTLSIDFGIIYTIHYSDEISAIKPIDLLRSVLTPADEDNHINKQAFTVPFVCGARDLGEALRRIAEGAAMIRTKGLAGTGKKLIQLV